MQQIAWMTLQFSIINLHALPSPQILPVSTVHFEHVAVIPGTRLPRYMIIYNHYSNNLGPMTNDSRLLSAQSMGDTIVVIRPVYPLPWPTWMTKPCKNRGSSEFRPSSDGLHPSSDEVSNLSISLTFPPFHPPKAIHLPSTSRIQAPPLPPLVQVSWRPPVVGRSQGIESLVLSVSVDELRTARWYVAPPLAPGTHSTIEEKWRYDWSREF